MSLWIPVLKLMKYALIETLDSSMFVNVNHDGSCKQTQRLSFLVPNSFNLSKYPFDNQTISLNFNIPP